MFAKYDRIARNYINNNCFDWHRAEAARLCPEVLDVMEKECSIRTVTANSAVCHTYGIMQINQQTCEEVTHISIPEEWPTLFQTSRYKPSSDTVFKLRTVQNEKIRKILQVGEGHVVIAGGNALYHVSNELTYSDDVDCFFWGVDEAKANDIVKRIIDEVFGEKTIDGVTIPAGRPYRTTHAISIVDEETNLTYQLVQRIYKSPAEILHGFDIPVSKVLLAIPEFATLSDEGGAGSSHQSEYEIGYSAWATPSFILAMKYRAFWIDPERQSKNYVKRIFKYRFKGFDVILIGVDRKKIKKAIFTTPIDKLKGIPLALRQELRVLDYCALTKTDVNNIHPNDCSFILTCQREADELEGKPLIQSLEEVDTLHWVTINPATQSVGGFNPAEENLYRGLY